MLSGATGLSSTRRPGIVVGVSTGTADLINAWASVAAAVGTVGAFAIGGVVLFRERRTEREAIERSQAEQVAAWHEVINGDDRRLTRAYVDARMIALIVGNASNLPVYQAMLFWELRTGEYDVKSMGVLGPRSERATGLRAEKRAGDWIEGAGLMFVDAAGIEWTRALNGELSRGHHEPTQLSRRVRDRDDH
jgi:hypothetical protein